MTSFSGPVLVYGAAGAQGRAIVNALLAAGAKVRVLLRPATANPFGAAVDLVRGDMSDLETLRRANDGVERVVLTLPTIADHALSVELGRKAVEAARAAGVQLMVFNEGGPIRSARTGVGLIDTRIVVEGHIEAAGVPTILLRPPIYMDNITAWGASAVLGQGVFAYPLPPDYPASWLAWSDLAAFVAAALARPDLAGRSFRIGGPEVLTGRQVAAILARATGRPVAYAPLHPAEFAAGVNAASGSTLGDEIGAYYRWLLDQASSPLAVDMAPVLAEMPVRLTTMAEWAAAQDWQTLGRQVAA